VSDIEPRYKLCRIIKRVGKEATLKVKRKQRPIERAFRCFRDPQARDVLSTPTTSSRRPVDDCVNSGFRERFLL